MNVWTGFMWLREKPMIFLLEYRKEPWGSIADDEFLD
jgi:hypothetical protein